MQTREADWPIGNGEMASRIRAYEWASTPLGSIESWPQSLKTAVDIVVASGHAMQLAWGPERTVLYNDAYAPMMGDRHPGALGAPSREAWPYLWNRIEPLVERVFAGETVGFENMPLVMTREGHPEETWWNCSYSPVKDESGAVAGLLNVAVDATPKVIADRAKEALRESEKRYRTLFDSINEGFCICERVAGEPVDFLYLASNPAFGRQSGFSNPVGKTIRQLIPTIEESIMERYRSVVETGCPQTFESHVAELDRWFEIEATPTEPQGRIVILFRDITVSRHAESALREREAHYRSLFEGIDEGYCVIRPVRDEKGQIVDLVFTQVNPAFDRHTGLGDVTGRSVAELLPNFEQHWIDLYSRTVNTGTPETYEHYVQDVDRWYRVHHSRIGSPGSDLVAVVLEEITERKRQEIALRESEERLALAIEIGEMASWDWDLRSNRVKWSDRHFLMQGYAVGEVTPSNEAWVNRVHPEDREETVALIEEARDERRTYIHEFRSLHPDGKVVWCSARGRFFYDADGQPYRMLGVMEDITSHKRAEEVLRESEVRQAFLLKLSDAVGPIADPVAIQERASRLTAEHLDVGRVAYCEIRYEPNVVVIVERDWSRHGMPSIAAGRYRMDDFGSFLAEELTAGRPAVVADAGTDPRISEAERNNWRQFDIVSNCAIPVMKEGRFVACFAAQDNRRHDWTDREIALLREVSERTWAAAERARAERALRDELHTMTRLHELANRLLAISDLRTGLGEVLDAALEVFEGGRGTIQILDPEVNALRYATARGFDEDALAAMAPIAHDFHSTRATAIHSSELVGKIDIRSDSRWADHEGTAGTLGYTTAISSPMMTRREELLGFLTVHLEGPYAATDRELRWADLFTQLAAHLVERSRAEAALRESEERLRAELSGSQLLQRLSTRLIPEQLPGALHEQILDAALELMQADAVSIQLLEDDGQRLHRLATRNLHPESAEYWTWVDTGHASTCGQALRRNQRVVIEDVETSAELAGTGDLEAFRRSGTRAVQSTPLVSRSGRPIGMISTHWREPRRLAESDFGLFDILARQVADLLERSQNEAALRKSEEQFRRAVEEAPIPIIMHAEDGQVLQLSRAWTEVTGYQSKDMPTFEAWLSSACGDEANGVRGHMRELLQGNQHTINVEFRMHTKTGELRHWAFSASSPGSLEDGRKFIAGMAVDITERSQAQEALRANETRLRAQKEAFQAAVSGAPLQESLGILARLVNEETRGLARTAFYLASQDEATLHPIRGVGDMPDSYLDLADGFPIGRESLACGLANATGRPVITRDVTEEPGWRPWLHIAERYHYRGCWSFPIATNDRKYIGTFAMYFREPHDATAQEMGLAGMVTQTASIIISRQMEAEERARTEETLRQSEERLRQFGEASQDVLWIRDAETLQWKYLTPGFEAIYGLSREEAFAGNNYQSWLDLIVPEDRERATDSIKQVRAGQHVTFDYRIKRPSDGAIRWLRNTDFPITGQNGRVTLIGGIGHDLTELREAELRLQTLLEGIPQLVWRAVDSGIWTWGSPQWANYTGQSDADSRGWGWLEAVHPEDRGAAKDAWAHAVETGGFEVEYRLCGKSDGSFRWFKTRATPVRNEAGEIIEWLGTSTDIHELRELQERQKVLVAELQHRTRNLIGVIRSLADKSARSSVDLEHFRGGFRDRLDALARVQGLLSRLNEHDRVTFDELIRTEMWALASSAERVTLAGPAGIRLRSSTVQTLALALHELATNAMKYGALGQPSGHLAVTWWLQPASDGQGSRLNVDWRETGVAMPHGDGALQHRGQGRELIEQALPYQLKAKTHYELGPDGVHCTIAMTVSETTDSGDIPNE